MKNICMIAHRGYSGMYHENTALAFKKAAENCSGGAETDIRITSDGKLVCSHNADVVFDDGSVLAVSESTYEELLSKPLKNKKSDDTVFLCSFREYLEIMAENNMICFVELKGEFPDEKVREVFSLVEEVYSLEKCIMQSFCFDNLIKAREMFPSLPLMLTYGTSETGYERCFEFGFSLDCDYKAISEKMIEEFHLHGLEVALWTANTEEAFCFCKSLDVDYIESDYFGGNDL